eukprot:SAG31_NODE_2133_length_6372_cov_4.372071_8_plen_85_part_00
MRKAALSLGWSSMYVSLACCHIHSACLCLLLATTRLAFIHHVSCAHLLSLPILCQKPKEIIPKGPRKMAIIVPNVTADGCKPNL